FTYFISLQHFTRLCSCFFFMLPPPPRSTLFPYTTLFRSIGALFAGFLAGYLMVGIRKLCDHLPSALEGIKPTLIYPVLGVLLMGDRKSTRLNSSHVSISYAVFCLKKKRKENKKVNEYEHR